MSVGTRVGGERLFGRERRDDDALVDAQRGRFEERDGEEDARPLHPVEASEAQNDHLLPLLRDVHRQKRGDQVGEGHEHHPEGPAVIQHDAQGQGRGDEREGLEKPHAQAGGERLLGPHGDGSRFSRFAFFFFLPDTTGPFLCRGALGGRIDSDVDAEVVRDDPDDFFGGHA